MLYSFPSPWGVEEMFLWSIPNCSTCKLRKLEVKVPYLWSHWSTYQASVGVEFASLSLGPSITSMGGSRAQSPVRVGATIAMYTKTKTEVESIKDFIERSKQKMAQFNKDSKKYTIQNISGGKVIEVTLTVRSGFYAQSASMFKVLKIIKHFATTKGSLPIYMRGETGVGKTQLAEIFHYNSDRKDFPFEAINCAAISEHLLESELFGSCKGAYNDARDKPGIFELANGGTVFLDEVSALKSHHQTALLTTIDQKRARRVGADSDYDFDVQIISASNKSLTKMVEEGTFAADLYYRLEGINITIPPLRDREKDIVNLAEFFLENKNKRDKTNLKFSNDFKKSLEDYTYPGNIRQLEKIVEICMARCRIDEKEIIDFETLINADTDTDSRRELKGFGINTKSELVRFFQQHLTNIEYSNISAHDLSVEIISALKNETVTDLLKNELKILDDKSSSTLKIDNRTKELMENLVEHLNEILDLKDNKVSLLSFLKKVDDLTIFKEIEEIKLNSIKRLLEEGKTYREVGEMFEVTGQAIWNRIKQS